MDYLNKFVTRPTTSEATWTLECEQGLSKFIDNPDYSECKLRLPFGFMTKIRYTIPWYYNKTGYQKFANAFSLDNEYFFQDVLIDSTFENINEKSLNGFFVEHTFVKYSDTEIVKLFKDRKTKINVPKNSYYTSQTQVLRIDYVELILIKTHNGISMRLSVNLPPMSYTSEISEYTYGLFETCLQHKQNLHSTTVFTEFSTTDKLKERTTKFLNDVSSFKTAYCKQLTFVVDKEDNNSILNLKLI